MEPTHTAQPLEHSELTAHARIHVRAVTADRLVNSAMRDVDAGRAALAILREIAAATAQPDELAERLLTLLVGADRNHTLDIDAGFLGPIQKRLEVQSRGQAEA